MRQYKEEYCHVCNIKCGSCCCPECFKKVMKFYIQQMMSQKEFLESLKLDAKEEKERKGEL